MAQRKQLNQQIVEVLTEDAHIVAVKDNIIEEYKQLSEKCDTVIAKIKNRKSKKNHQS